MSCGKSSQRRIKGLRKQRTFRWEMLLQFSAEVPEVLNLLLSLFSTSYFQGIWVTKHRA